MKRGPYIREFILLVLLAVVPRVKAHRLDDLLQASLIEVTPTEIRLQLNLNPGAEVADKVIWMIDRNRDRTISAPEAETYARSLADTLAFSLDDHPIKLEFLAARCDSMEELRSGMGIVHIEMRGLLPLIRAGTHKLRFENQYLPEISAYLVNALLPRDSRIKIQKQERNDNQSVGWIDFSMEREKVEWGTRMASLGIFVFTFAGLLFLRQKFRTSIRFKML